MWNNFAGHPILHRYDYLMSVQHQHDLLTEAERERQLSEVNEVPGALQLYYAWIYEMKWYLEHFSRAFMKSGRARESQSSSRSAVAEMQSLKVLRAQPARRIKWN